MDQPLVSEKERPVLSQEVLWVPDARANFLSLFLCPLLQVWFDLATPGLTLQDCPFLTLFLKTQLAPSLLCETQPDSAQGSPFSTRPCLQVG